MVTNFNSDTSKELIDAGKLQTGYDKIPSEFSDKIVFTAETNPKFFRRINVVRRYFLQNATSGTIYSAPSDKDFFIVGAALSVVKDVTATSNYSLIQFTDEDGATRELLQIAGLTLTVQDQTMSISLPYPIKVKRGTAITVQNASNVANVTASGIIMGYFVQNSNS